MLIANCALFFGTYRDFKFFPSPDKFNHAQAIPVRNKSNRKVAITFFTAKNWRYDMNHNARNPTNDVKEIIRLVNGKSK